MRESQGTSAPGVPANVLKVAIRVCEKRLRELDDLIDDPSAFQELVTDEEWRILGADELNMETLAQKKHEDWLAKNEVMQAEKRKQEKAKEEKERKKKKKKKKVVEEDKEGEGADEGGKGAEEEEEDIIDDEDDEKGQKEDQDAQIGNRNPEFKKCLKILEELKKKYP